MILGDATFASKKYFVWIFQCYMCYNVTSGHFFRKRSTIYINYLLLIYIILCML